MFLITDIGAIVPQVDFRLDQACKELRCRVDELLEK